MSIRASLPLILLLAALGAAYAAWTWSDLLTTMRGDSAVYLLMARHYAIWRTIDPIAAEVARNSQFPPIYSLLLAYTGASASVRAANLLTVALDVITWLALAIWAVRLGASRVSAGLLVIAVAALPQGLRLALNPQSEHLYLPLSIAVLLALDEYRRSGRASMFHLAALAAIAAALTRTLGVALFVPLAICALQRREMRLLGTCALAFAPMVAWHLVHHPLQPYGEYVAGFYGRGNLESALAFVAGAPQRLLQGLADNLSDSPNLHAPALGLAIALYAAAAWRAIRLRDDGVYLLAYLLIVAIWPFPGETRRFIFAIVPVLAGQLAVSIAELRRARAPPALAPVAIVLLLTPGVLHVAERYLEGLKEPDARLRSFPEWYEPDASMARARAETLAMHIDALRRIEQVVPADGCVINVYPILVKYFAHRVAVEPPIPELDDAAFQHQLGAQPCEYIFLMTAVGGHFTEAMYPLRRIASQLRVVDAEPPAALDGHARPVALLAKIVQRQ